MLQYSAILLSHIWLERLVTAVTAVVQTHFATNTNG
jgi:hypothetical protein